MSDCALSHLNAGDYTAHDLDQGHKNMETCLPKEQGHTKTIKGTQEKKQIKKMAGTATHLTTV